MRAIENLADVPLFADLKPAEREWIASHIHRRRFRADTTIILRGAPGVALYILLSGRVKVLLESLDGRDTIVAVLHPGDLVGELALLDGAECCADVITLEPVEALVMTRADLLECIREVPQIAMNMLGTLAARLRRANELIHTMATLDAQGKVARQLLTLAELNGVPSPGGVRIDLRVHQSELASSLGVTRETVARALASFRRQGWITTEKGQQITLLRQDQLARRCGAESDS